MNTVTAEENAVPDVSGPDVGPIDAAGATVPALAERKGFHVRLENFDGPFDLLLQLISARQLDVTEIALHKVTDEFIAYTRDLGDDLDLGVVTEFLVVAATLLELKAARLLPTDPDDASGAEDALLEARDLLFARLLAYRAYQQVTVLFRELEAGALRRYPRAVTLEQRYLGLLPEVQLSVTDLVAAAERAFAPKPPPPTVSLDHIHSSPVSVAEHTAVVRAMLADLGQATFSQLVAGCTLTLEVVARFLGLLNLYREAAVAFEQAEPLGELTVRWTGRAASVNPDDENSEEYE